jgi:hypothetical protein
MRVMKILSYATAKGDVVPVHATITLTDQGRILFDPKLECFDEVLGLMGKRFTPADGKAYFDALPLQFRNPYFMAIEFDSQGKKIIS